MPPKSLTLQVFAVQDLFGAYRPASWWWCCPQSSCCLRVQMIVVRRLLGFLNMPSPPIHEVVLIPVTWTPGSDPEIRPFTFTGELQAKNRDLHCVCQARPRRTISPEEMHCPHPLCEWCASECTRIAHCTSFAEGEMQSSKTSCLASVRGIEMVDGQDIVEMVKMLTAWSPDSTNNVLNRLLNLMPA